MCECVCFKSNARLEYFSLIFSWFKLSFFSVSIIRRKWIGWLKTIIFHFIIIGWSLKLIFINIFLFVSFFSAAHNIKTLGGIFTRNQMIIHVIHSFFSAAQSIARLCSPLFYASLILKISNTESGKNIEHNFVCLFSRWEFFCSCRVKEHTRNSLGEESPWDFAIWFSDASKNKINLIKNN